MTSPIYIECTINTMPLSISTNIVITINIFICNILCTFTWERLDFAQRTLARNERESRIEIYRDVFMVVRITDVRFWYEIIHLLTGKFDKQMGNPVSEFFRRLGTRKEIRVCRHLGTKEKGTEKLFGSQMGSSIFNLSMSGILAWFSSLCMPNLSILSIYTATIKCSSLDAEAHTGNWVIWPWIPVLLLQGENLTSVRSLSL